MARGRQVAKVRRAAQPDGPVGVCAAPLKVMRSGKHFLFFFPPGRDNGNDGRFPNSLAILDVRLERTAGNGLRETGQVREVLWQQPHR
jgi:hypothetical protein